MIEVLRSLDAGAHCPVKALASSVVVHHSQAVGCDEIGSLQISFAAFVCDRL